MVRAKFRLSEVHNLSWSQTAQRFVFEAQYDTAIPEDQRFSKATPTCRFEMTVDNPAAQQQFKLGESYYFDVSPVGSPAAA